MKKILFFSALLTTVFACDKNPGSSSQPPVPNNKALAWINTFGGSNNDFAYSAAQMPDSNFVFAGATRSTDGDILGSRIGYDAWIAKIDKEGKKMWSKTYGDNNDNYINSVITTPDGGLMVAGYTFIGNTNNTAWVIKTDRDGNQQWRKDFTQSLDAKAQTVTTTQDGGYLVGGHSFTNTTKYDGWIVKLDGSGNELWSRNYGGSLDDYATAIIKAHDRGYVVSGYTKSADGDITRENGGVDAWVIKIDDNGNRVWSKNYGGSSDDYAKTIIRTNDNSYMIAGYSNSRDGDVVGNKGGYDEWVVKIDLAGNKQWAKTFGGATDDFGNGLVTTADGGYMLAGYTNSTNGDVTRPGGDFGGFLVKFDGNGNKTAVSTYGDSFDNFTSALINTLDSGYLLSGYSSLSNTTADAWLVKVLDLR